MKYLILLGDGMADEPIEELGGKTPLEYANTPNMDTCAGHLKGMLRTVPDSMPPGSDVANLSVLGYDVEKYYTGRAPLEAAAKGIELKENDVAYRCNFVTIENETMKDFSAGHIDSKKAKLLIELLNREIKIPGIRFYPGVSYRNIMIWENGETDTTTPPHDITGKPIKDHLPMGTTGTFLLNIMNKASTVLRDNTIHPEANAIWLWGEGSKPKLPSFSSMWNKNGCIISAVDLMIGIGKLIGLYIPFVPGITGFIDTNYRGKIEAATSFIAEGGDFAYVHVEATDEVSHMGDLEKKIEAIEIFDREIVGKAIEFARGYSDRVKIAVLPDHPTPIRLKTHTSEPVPFAVFDSGETINTRGSYSEKSCSKGMFIDKGHTFLKQFFDGG